MFKTFPPGSTSIAAIAVVLLGAASVSWAADEINRFESGRLLAPAGRATGLLHVDFPMSIRVRFDSTYTNDFYLSDTLARPYAFAEGPWLSDDPSLENRFALTKMISEKIEIGVVWRSRSSISKLYLFDFERQIVAAMIRITP